MLRKIFLFTVLLSFVMLSFNIPVYAIVSYEDTSEIEYKQVNDEFFNEKTYYNGNIQDDIIVKYINNDLNSKVVYKPTKLEDYPVILTARNLYLTRITYEPKAELADSVEVYIAPVKKIKTKSFSVKVKQEDGKKKSLRVYTPHVGQKYDFVILHDVMLGDKVLIKKGEIFEGRVGEVSTRAMGGAPAEILIENFVGKDAEGNPCKLSGEIESSGVSFSLIIGLVELGTTPFLFGCAAPMLRFFKGTNAVVSPKKEYEVYYEYVK